MSKSKNFFSAFIGTALEFYDFALFGLLAPIFATQFFPKEDPIAALILSYGVFATGFLTRPLGGMFLGYIGDLYGRKKAMVISIIAMMIPTILIGILPTYEQIGIIAPVLLIGCRLIQGLCAGGEFSGAAIFVIEHSHPDKKYFSGSLVTASSVVGMLFASAVASVSLLTTNSTWAWRIPFLLCVPIGLIGFYIRTHTQETAAFNKIITIGERSLIALLKSNLRSLLITFGIGSFIGILYYVPFVFIGHYLVLVSAFSSSAIMLIMTCGLIVYMFCIGLAGYIADKTTPQAVMLTATLTTSILIYPVFCLINSGEHLAILLGELMLAALAGTFVGPANGLTASLFEIKNRSRCVSFSFSLGISLFGGLTPILLTYLINKTEALIWPVIWIIFGVLIATCSVLASIKNEKKLEAVDSAIITLNTN